MWRSRRPGVIIIILKALLIASIDSHSEGHWDTSKVVKDNQGKLKTLVNVQDKVSTALWSSLQQSILKNNAAQLREDADITVAVEPNKDVAQNRVWPFLQKAHLEGGSQTCDHDYFVTNKGHCRKCRHCGNDEIEAFPCTVYSDTVCKPLKHKYTRCIILLKQRHGKRHLKRYFLGKAIRPGRLCRCFKYLARYFLQLNVKKSKRGNIRSKRENPTIFKKLNDMDEKFSEAMNGTTVLPGLTITRSDEELFDIELNGKTRFKMWSINGQKDSTTRPQLADSSDSSGISPWVYILIGVAVAMLLATSFVLTLLYRKRQRVLKESSKSSRQQASYQDENAHSLMYDTLRSGSADKGTERSKSTVLTFLSSDSHGYSERGDNLEFFELMPLYQLSPRAQLSTMDFLSRPEDAGDDISYFCPANIESTRSQSAPFVSVINSSHRAPAQQTCSCLPRPAFVRAEANEVSRQSSKNTFQSSEQDDGYKLRGGNGDFHRRYVDVDYVHNDFELARDKLRHSDITGKQRSLPRVSGGSPEAEYYTPVTRYPRERGRNESNASSSTSHHSVRSYISMPPTSPSENYIEAGSLDTSGRSERSTPPIKMEWLTKTIKTDIRNELRNYQTSLGTQTDSDVNNLKQKTVFGTSWQFGGTFTSRGGMMQASDSDISITLPANALPKEIYLDIYGAIFTDTMEIRKKFDFPAEESLITPVVEYHAVPAIHFFRPVCIELPHSLPEDFDASLIRVYTFTVDDYGIVTLSLVPMGSKTNTDLANEFSWTRAGSGRSINISTTHFSGYFCTMCETSSLPSICTMVFGSHVEITPSRREVRVILYIWDRRLTIKDYLERFRKHESDVDRQLLTDMQVPLLDDASSDSRLVMKMDVMGHENERQVWRYVCRPDGSRPLFKQLQVRKLSEIVHCCRQTDPIRVEWALENVPQQIPGTVFQCCIDIMHVPESTRDYETAMREDIDDLMRTFYVRNLKVVSHGMQDLKPNENLLRGNLERTLSEAMNMAETQKMCQEFGISIKDIGNFRKKFSTEEKFQIGLVEECLRRHGQEKFMQQLPFILEKLHMAHALSVLENRKIIVRDLADFAGLPDGPGLQTSQTSPNGSQQRDIQAGVNCDTDRTILKSPYYQRSESPGHRNQSTSPTHGRANREDARGSERPKYHQQLSEKSDEVFAQGGLPHRPQVTVDHVNRGPYEYSGNKDCHRGNTSPTDEDDYKNDSYGPVHVKHGNDNLEEPLQDPKNSSSGSDSVLRGSSLPSRDNAPESSILPQLSTLGSSIIAQADSIDFAEPYPDEFLDEFQNQTYKKEPAASKHVPARLNSQLAAYPEITEELHLSDSGPNALPPRSQDNKAPSSDLHRLPYSTPFPHQTGVKSVPGHHSQETDQDETSRKELYGIHTVV